MDIVDSALDFIEFIILLVAMIIISFRFVLPMNEQINELQYNTTYDKTISEVNGEMTLDFSDGCLTLNQVVAQLSSQNSYLNTPRKAANIEDTEVLQAEKDKLEKSDTNAYLQIGSTKINLTGLPQYDSSAASTARVKIVEYMNSKGLNAATAKYKIMFYMGTDASATDNTYLLYYFDDTSNSLVPCL